MANALTQFAPPFDALLLDCALAASGKATPTEAELAAGLREVYPNGGPIVADVVAAGWLEPTIDKKRLRVPPMSLEQQQHRIAEAPPSTQTPEPRFSLYRGGVTTTKPTGALNPAGLYGELTSPNRRAQTEALRAAPPDSPQQAALKRRLDYVTPAGIFTHRKNDGLVHSSGLLVLDFDHLPHVEQARAALLADEMLAPEVVLVFTSPRGEGFKALLKTDPRASHGENFKAYADHLAYRYRRLGLVPDPSGRDVARACFVPYAPDAWMAPAYA